MNPSSQDDSEQIQLRCLQASPDGANIYVAQQRGDLRLLSEALRASLRLTLAVTTLRLNIALDGPNDSGVLDFVEDLRQDYGINASVDHVASTDNEDDGDAGSDSDDTIILEQDDEEAEAVDTSEGNKENVAPRSPSPEEDFTPMSPPESTAGRSPSPSPPPGYLPPRDPWRTAIEDFEADKAVANVHSNQELPLKMYLNFLLSFLKFCTNVTVVSLPLEWRTHMGERVKVAFLKLKELRWTADMGQDEVEYLGGEDEATDGEEEDELDVSEQMLNYGDEEEELDLGSEMEEDEET